MKFKDLSENAITVIEKMLENEELVKLVAYDDATPYDNANVVNKSDLVLTKFFPTPVDYQVTTETHSEVRVFFPQGEVKNKKIMGNIVVFQILVHKDLWLMKEGLNKKIRPYEIMGEIVEVFENKSHAKVGVLHFTDYKFIRVNKDFSGYELIADMMTIG